MIVSNPDGETYSRPRDNLNEEFQAGERYSKFHRLSHIRNYWAGRSWEGGAG